MAAMKTALDSCGISVQRYWNATLVGPDCRRFIENSEEILGAIRAAMLSALSTGRKIATIRSEAHVGA